MLSSDSLFTGAFLIGIPLVSALAFFILRTRRFYFVRHGETLLNAEHIRQGEAGALSDKGRAQAERVGQYLKQFPITSILSSDYPRARETASIIRAQVHAPIFISALLVERRNPTDIIGKSTKDPRVIEIVNQMDLAYNDDDFRMSDEENFADLKKRGRKCINLLAAQSVGTTVVVTHHVFLKMCIAYILYRERLHSSDFVKLSFFNYSDNAGITICEFSPWRIFSPTRGWRVVSYNQVPE